MNKKVFIVCHAQLRTLILFKIYEMIDVFRVLIVQQIKSVYGRIFQFVMQASDLVHMLSKHS